MFLSCDVTNTYKVIFRFYTYTVYSILQLHISSVFLMLCHRPPIHRQAALLAVTNPPKLDSECHSRRAIVIKYKENCAMKKVQNTLDGVLVVTNDKQNGVTLLCGYFTFS